MFKKKARYEVVPESEYSDFSHRNGKKQTLSKTALAGSGITAAAVAVTTYGINSAKTSASTYTPIYTPAIEPINVLTQTPPTIPVNGISPDMLVPTGVVADTSLNMLATVLDPLLQILVAISFPIASVIMVGACFFFMLGNSEKAWQTIFNAGLGYVLIQMSPLFLQILREIGKAV